MGTEVQGESFLMTQYIKKYSIEPELFQFMREEVLDLIEEVKSKYDCSFSSMTHSDYLIKHNNRLPIYSGIVKSTVQPFLDDYARDWCCSETRVNEMWFCQYEDGARFNWHTHEGSNLSAVLHLFGKKEYSTQIMGSTITMQEGDFVVFPAMLPHRGPEVFCGNKKYSIGMNLDIFGSTLNDK